MGDRPYERENIYQLRTKDGKPAGLVGTYDYQVIKGYLEAADERKRLGLIHSHAEELLAIARQEHDEAEAAYVDQDAVCQKAFDAVLDAGLGSVLERVMLG